MRDNSGGEMMRGALEVTDKAERLGLEVRTKGDAIEFFGHDGRWLFAAANVYEALAYVDGMGHGRRGIGTPPDDDLGELVAGDWPDVCGLAWERREFGSRATLGDITLTVEVGRDSETWQSHAACLGVPFYDHDEHESREDAERAAVTFGVRAAQRAAAVAHGLASMARKAEQAMSGDAGGEG